MAVTLRSYPFWTTNISQTSNAQGPGRGGTIALPLLLLGQIFSRAPSAVQMQNKWRNTDLDVCLYWPDFFFSFTTLIWFPQSLMLHLTNVVTYKLKSYVTTNKTVDYLSWYLQQFLLSNAPPVGQWHPEGKKVKEEQKFSSFFSLANKAP